MNTVKKMPTKNNKYKEVTNYYTNKQPNIVYGKNNHYYDILIKFEKDLINEGLAKSTIYERKRNMKCFLFYLEQKQMLNLNEINIETVNNYLDSLPKYYCKQTQKNIYKEIRLAIKYLYKSNIITTDLSIFIPHIKVSRVTTIPSIWSEIEIQKIFEQINLNSKSGKRLYLVLLLSIRFGLRYGDIINLKFDDIDWKTKTIRIKQSKTGKEAIFTLLPDILSAIIDYVKNERPNSKEKNIILKSNGEKIEGHIFYNQISKLIKKSGINYKNKKRGIHSMRHTLASTLLNKNIPLPIISKVLEHSNNDTSLIYLKIDEKKLRKCCLSLKEVKIYE